MASGRFDPEEALDRLPVYEAIVKFLRSSILPVEADEDELLSAVAAAYPPEYLVPLRVIPKDPSR